MWTYDDWGGWYDHVGRHEVDGVRLRVPRAGAARQPLRAPRPRRQHAARLHLDPEVHRGQLGARAAGAARRRANSFAGAFDFSQPPRAPSIVPHGRRGAAPRARRSVIYVGYGAALLLAGILIGWAASAGPASRAGDAGALVLATRAVVPGSAVTAPPRPRREHPDRSGGPGDALRRRTAAFGPTATGAAHPPPVARARGFAARARHGDRAGRPRAVRPLVPGRRIAAINLYHRVRTSFVDLERHARRPERGQLVVVRGSRRQPPRRLRAAHALAAGQPRRAREQRPHVDATLLRGRAGARGRRERRPPRPAALLPRGQAAASSSGCCSSRCA